MNQNIENKWIVGGLGFALSVCGVISAFKIGVEEVWLFLVFLIVIILGIVIVTKMLSN